MKRSPLTCLLFLLCFCAFGQTGKVEIPVISRSNVLFVPAGLILPQDSVTQEKLLGSLRGWLSQKGQPVQKNTFVRSEDRVYTSVLMDEIRRMDSAYLTNVVLLDSAAITGGTQDVQGVARQPVLFLVQLAFMGLKNGVPELRACCEVLARRIGGQFFISSPLQQHTAAWKTKQIGNCLFHYKTKIDVQKAGLYQKKMAWYDRKLTTAAQIIDFYCCDNFLEAMYLAGVPYKMGYNGLAYDQEGGFADNHSVVICGNTWDGDFNSWDPHDSWHDRLHHIISPDRINRPVDEACAYLYGGSWRTYTPADVLRLFGEYATAHADADWVALYKDGSNFVPPPKILKISYAINALIIRQLEKERGFSAVLELLTCGKKEQGDANYFAALQRLTGVTEAGFNTFVGKLLKDN